MEKEKEERISSVEYMLALELIAKKIERMESRDKNYLHNPRYKELRRKQDSIYDKLRNQRARNLIKGGVAHEMGEDR
jgi:2-methylcitrate dehydratase PrpD